MIFCTQRLGLKIQYFYINNCPELSDYTCKPHVISVSVIDERKNMLHSVGKGKAKVKSKSAGGALGVPAS